VFFFSDSYFFFLSLFISIYLYPSIHPSIHPSIYFSLITPLFFLFSPTTKNNNITDIGPYDSDIDPKEGIEHAKCIAKRIAKGHHDPSYSCDDNKSDDDDNVNNFNYNNIEETIPKIVYADPFMRTTHTGHIIAKELGNNIQLRLEDGLWEWLIPSLLVEKSTGIKTEPKSVEDLKNIMKFNLIDTNYKSVHSYKNNMILTFPETEKQLFQRCGEITLSKLIKETEIAKTNTNNNNNNNDNSMYDSICIVSHAPCLQAMAYYLDIDSSLPEESKIVKPWPLGGITMFSRIITIPTTTTTTSTSTTTEDEDEDGDEENDKEDDVVITSKWKCEFYGCTDHMIGEYKNGIKEWSLSCFGINNSST
jgi:phosphohistidine phosphatase SixA